MNSGVGCAVRNRQHGNIHLAIFFHAIYRQCPEVRRGPGKDDQNQQQTTAIYAARDCCPAKKRWGGTKEAAYHNVLRRGSLEVDGIDKTVANPGCQIQPGSQRIYQNRQQGKAGNACDSDKDSALSIADAPLRHRAIASAGHAGIYIGINQMVERGCRTGYQGDSQIAKDNNAPGHTAICSQKHSRQARTAT